MNLKYHMHLCFIFTEHSRCSSEQQTESLKRGCDPVLLGGAAGNICPVLHIRREFW